MEKIMFWFDKEGDILDISIGKPKEALSREIGDDITVRINPQTKEVVGFTILNFEKRFKGPDKPEEISLPIIGSFRLSS